MKSLHIKFSPAQKYCSRLYRIPGLATSLSLFSAHIVRCRMFSILSTYCKMQNVRAREMEGARDLSLSPPVYPPSFSSMSYFLPLSALCLVMTRERLVASPSNTKKGYRLRAKNVRSQIKFRHQNLANTLNIHKVIIHDIFI